MKTPKLNYAFVALCLILVAIPNLKPVKANQTTLLQLTPEEKYVTQAENFTLTVYVSNVTNLNKWQITVKFDPSVLKCINVTIPQDNIFAGYQIINPPPKIDNENGSIVKFTALDGVQGINGSGKLAEIEFSPLSFSCLTYVEFTGINQINPVNGTYMQDPQDQPIDFQPSNSQIHLLPTPHVFNVSKNNETYKVTIFTNSTSINAFNYNETGNILTFNLTGPQNSLSFTCTQTPKALFNSSYYVVKADSAILPTTIIQNSTHALICFKYNHTPYETKIIIIPTGPGDLNGDRKVNIKDVVIPASAFGSYIGHVRWNPIADINQDGKVDIRDVSFIAYHFGSLY